MVNGITELMNSNHMIVDESNEKLENTIHIFNDILHSSEEVIGTTNLLKEELVGVVDIKEKLLEAMNQVEEVSRVSVENTAQISGSTQEQVSGVQEILVSMEKMQQGMQQLSAVVNAG